KAGPTFEINQLIFTTCANKYTLVTIAPFVTNLVDVPVIMRSEVSVTRAGITFASRPPDSYATHRIEIRFPSGHRGGCTRLGRPCCEGQKSGISYTGDRRGRRRKRQRSKSEVRRDHLIPGGVFGM